jgi:Tfp pilus assembly protein PilF
VLFRQGHGAQAKSIAAKVLERSPDNTDALLVMALVDWGEGKLADARRVLERAVQLSDRYADLYLVLGRIAERQGDRQVARASYEHVLALEPENQEVARRLARGH